MAVENKGSYKWLLVASLWVIGCLNYMDRQAIFSAFPLLKKELSMSDVQLGLLGSAFLWCYSASSPLAGYLGDRFKRKSVILGSLFIFSLATLGTGLAIAPAQLIWLRGLLGLSEALYLPAALALIADYHAGGTRSQQLVSIRPAFLQEASWVRSSPAIWGSITGGAMPSIAWAFRNCHLLFDDGLDPGNSQGRKRFFDSPGSPSHYLAFAGNASLYPDHPNGIGRHVLWPVDFYDGLAVMAWMPAYLYERFGLSLTKAAFDGVFYISVTTALGILSAVSWLTDGQGGIEEEECGSS